VAIFIEKVRSTAFRRLSVGEKPPKGGTPNI